MAQDMVFTHSGDETDKLYMPLRHFTATMKTGLIYREKELEHTFRRRYQVERVGFYGGRSVAFENLSEFKEEIKYLGWLVLNRPLLNLPPDAAHPPSMLDKELSATTVAISLSMVVELCDRALLVEGGVELTVVERDLGRELNALDVEMKKRNATWVYMPAPKGVFDYKVVDPS